MSNWGFVYCLSNDAMPGLLKVGYTTKNPMARAEELSASSGVPAPFQVLFYLETKNPAQMEAMVHASLENYRKNESREFFRVCDSMVIRAMQECSDGEGAIMESHAYQGLVSERKLIAGRAANTPLAVGG
jgi:hypothetical protein